MKILTYNINGLKQFYNKGLLDKLFVDFPDIDVYCFQEVKAVRTDVIHIMDDVLVRNDKHDYAWNYDENLYKKGYAGTLTIFKPGNTGSCCRLGLTDKNSRHTLTYNEMEYWDGRFVRLSLHELNIFNVYVPNSGNKQRIREEFDATLYDYLNEYKGDFNIIVGDMNVCSTELDYWGNYQKSINTCPGLMDFEIMAFHKLLLNGYTDVFRKMNKEERKYSYYPVRAKNSIENNKGWRLDYVLVDTEHYDKIKNIEIVSGYNGADHSPVIVEINI